MTRREFNHLMVTRRSLGDFGTEVSLPKASFKAFLLEMDEHFASYYVGQTEHQRKSTLADDVQRNGYFTVNSVNGPTKVRPA